MLRRVAIVRTDVSEELSACVVCELSLALYLLSTRMKEAKSFTETTFLTRATLRNIPEDANIHSHRRENLKSYIINPVLHCFLQEKRIKC
jgi:hypothetical protein